MHSSLPSGRSRSSQTGDQRIRRATGGSVVAVALFAAVVSYSHIYALGRSHGGSVLAAALLPLSVDGLIVAASLVMLHEARQRRGTPVLARLMLGLGVAATLAANVAYGAAYGRMGAVIWAWPAVAFVGAAEMVMLQVRRAAPPLPGKELVPFRPEVATDVESAARVAFEATVAAGNPYSERALAEKFNLSRAAARRIRETVSAGANGHSGPPDGP